MNPQRSYASGFVDALALVSVTLLILFAALIAGGCAHAPPPPAATFVLVDCAIVDLETGRRTPCQ